MKGIAGLASKDALRSAEAPALPPETSARSRLHQIGRRRAPPAHRDVLRSRGFDGDVGAARPRGHARDHRGLSQMLCDADRASGGFVAKYMGDGVLAYFGYPRAHEHDAERAVQSRARDRRGCAEVKTAVGATVHVRVGIATGIVVVGDLLGSGEAQERGVVGDTPNSPPGCRGSPHPTASSSPGHPQTARRPLRTHGPRPTRAQRRRRPDARVCAR